MAFRLSSFANVPIPTAVGFGSHDVGSGPVDHRGIVLPGGRSYDPYPSSRAIPRGATPFVTSVIFRGADMSAIQSLMEPWLGLQGQKGTLIRTGDNGRVDQVQARLTDVGVARASTHKTHLPVQLRFITHELPWKSNQVANDSGWWSTGSSGIINVNNAGDVPNNGSIIRLMSINVNVALTIITIMNHSTQQFINITADMRAGASDDITVDCARRAVFNTTTGAPLYSTFYSNAITEAWLTLQQGNNLVDGNVLTGGGGTYPTNQHFLRVTEWDTYG